MYFISDCYLGKNPCKSLISLLLLLLFPVTGMAAKVAVEPEAQAAAQKIVHILDYIAVDYPGVVNNGQITNPEEFKEQQEFAGHVLQLVEQLPDSEKAALRQQADKIVSAIQRHVPGQEVADLSNAMSVQLIETFRVSVVPRIMPAGDQAAKVFQENCSMCHGLQGFGDGPRAVGLEPAPANFHERERQQHRSLFSLYNTISLGVAGTAMPAFDQFSAQERWQLAFYVSNFFASDEERARGEALLSDSGTTPVIKNLNQLTQTTPAQMLEKYGEKGLAELVYLRSNPSAMQTNTNEPLRKAENKLHASLKAYQNGDLRSAYDLAVSAYLDGFEMVETPLNAAHPELRLRIEKAMLHHRDLIKQDAGLDKILASNDLLVEMLAQARSSLDSGELSSSVNFFSAFLILLREGLEAILILAAISAVLIKTGRSDMLRYLHFGWISALLLGGLTWLVAGQFLNVSGASREVTEGITALVAAVMLIYIGFWLHKQTYAAQWQQFIREKVDKSLGKSTFMGMAAVAFIAVYREVFETILFFQTLWMQSGDAGRVQITSGMLTAAVLLVLVAWGIFKFSVRLPLKWFFQINSVFLYVLAIIFAGKGIAALQEAGKLREDPVNFFKVDALGIFPNLESLGIQLVMIVIAVALYVYSQVKLNRKEATG